MIQIKKTILTLVALLALTAGAWAQDAFGVKEIVPPADWENDETNATKGDFPGFVGITIDQAKAWTGAPSSGLAVLFYNFDGEDISYAYFLNGTFNSSDSNILQRMNIYNAFANGVKQYYTASAASTVEVAWDKAEKTGTFKMPGGNVTLEPEYYPQAALTAQPTAINDVPATTDGAIVKAGTVANIGSTETAQGTLMYYVSPTPMTDAQLLALAADQWTADVPTAEKLAQGQAYVYYYVRGNDGDTDDETFSDGDILAANALTVTIAAAPTYAVTFADDLAEPTLWTASPNAGVTKGQTVTVTYSGSKKVLGVKAEKKASTVPVTAITLNKTATTIYKLNDNSTETLSVTAVTPDEATDKTYTWSSDDITKATVDQNGVVTAVAEGTAHIRATANDGSGVYGECTVTVSDLSVYYSKMVECGCDNLNGKCYNGGSLTFTGQVLSADQAIALAKAKAAETSSNCAVFYDNGSLGSVTFAKNDGTTGSARHYYDASGKGLSGYRGYYVSK